MPTLCAPFKRQPLAACRLRTLKLMDSRELMLLSGNIWTKTSFSLRGGFCRSSTSCSASWCWHCVNKWSQATGSYYSAHRKPTVSATVMASVGDFSSWNPSIRLPYDTFIWKPSLVGLPCEDKDDFFLFMLWYESHTTRVNTQTSVEVIWKSCFIWGKWICIDWQRDLVECTFVYRANKYLYCYHWIHRFTVMWLSFSHICS